MTSGRRDLNTGRRSRRRTLLSSLTAAVTLLVLVGCGGSSHSGGPRLVSIGAGLTGPRGLKATVFAHGPATVSMFAFDPQGRLWMTAAGLSSHAKDGVYLVPRAGARAVRVVAGLREPLGLLWRGGSLYVASLGRVDAYTGFNGLRFATHREVLAGPVRGGENNGLVVAPDGRLLMGVTASCDHCVPPSPYSGAIVSFRPGGSDLRVFAKRIRAPVGLAYVPGTGELLVSMNLRDDLGAKTPGDWLSAVREGQDWGAPGCYGQGGSACRGVPKPLAILDPHAAVGGLAVLDGQLGTHLGRSVLVAEWQGAKVQRVPLAGHATSGASATPFLTGMQHPLALALAPDRRSVLVGDWATGTIYRVSGDASG